MTARATRLHPPARLRRMAGAAAAFALAAAGLAQADPETVDTLFLKEPPGSTRAGHIRGLDENSFRLEVPLEGAGPGTKATVTVPRDSVDRIEFALDEDRDEMLAAADIPDLPAVAALWNRWEPFLGVAKSPAGAIANVYGDLLLRTGDPDRAAEALALFERVESSAWDENATRTAKQGKLRAMIATGRAEDAVGEALALARESEDPEVLIEAKFILAQAAHQALVELEEENPRWEEDVNVRPERARLYDEAINLYLYPYLFFGSETAPAARGLWGATEVYRIGGDIHNALESARDLVILYPGTPFARQAQEFIDSLPDEAKEQDNEKDAQNEA